jgi:hypothetical protein
MTSIIIDKKTGFMNMEPTRPVVIRDFRGKLFYSTEGLRSVKEFNLPPGNYTVEKGNIKFRKIPVDYPLSALPKPERNLRPPFDYKIIFDNNPNKCTIKWLEKIIIFDNELKQLTLPELFFILYHEFAHAKFQSEKYADLMAGNIMLKKGYNPSQIGKAPITSLSTMQYERKKHIVKNMIKNTFK